jgi:DNA-binding NarL/FixJ family response regulator
VGATAALLHPPIAAPVPANLVRLLVVDDHPAVRIGLVAFLELEDGIQVVGEAENGLEVLELLDRLRADVILMDVRMPVLDGTQATALIKRARPQTGIVLVTAYEQDELRALGLASGADAFVCKGVLGAELAAVIRAVGSAPERLDREDVR